MLTQSELKELFSYKDGELYWKKKIAPKVKIGKIAGYTHHSGYKFIQIYGKMHLSHRLIFLYHKGYLPEYLDHIDGNQSNNHIENLRECTLSQNQYNSKIPSTNKSGIKGVHWSVSSNMWHAVIAVNNKTIHLGFFNDLAEAKNEIEKARERHHDKFCNHG